LVAENSVVKLLLEGNHISGQRMIRIREIVDPELRKRIVEALAERRGCSVAAIPDWFELDDADYVDLLNQLKENEQGDESLDDPRM
jgi:hypothetical protein